jgi:hypothetical protein
MTSDVTTILPIFNIIWQLHPMPAFRQPLSKKDSSILPDLRVLRNSYYITQSRYYFWILESFSKLLSSLKTNLRTVRTAPIHHNV